MIYNSVQIGEQFFISSDWTEFVISITRQHVLLVILNIEK